MAAVTIWLLLLLSRFQFSSVQFSRSVVSDSLLPHESQHARPPCPSRTPGVHPDSVQLSHPYMTTYSGLISFRTDWFDLLAVQGNLKSLLQYHNSKASILQWSAFFMVQLSHPYTITGKTIALTRWTFVSKVMSLLFNTLSRFIIAS